MQGEKLDGRQRPWGKKYRVQLSEEERCELERMIGAGSAAARKLMHARVLLKADEGPQGPGWTDEQIMEALEVGQTAVGRIRQRYVEAGLRAALERKRSERIYAHQLDGAGEAHLVALACAQPPEGRKCWTLALLADRMVTLGETDHLSYESVRRVLKKTRSSRG